MIVLIVYDNNTFYHFSISLYIAIHTPIGLIDKNFLLNIFSITIRIYFQIHSALLYSYNLTGKRSHLFANNVHYNDINMDMFIHKSIILH